MHCRHKSLCILSDHVILLMLLPLLRLPPLCLSSPYAGALVRRPGRLQTGRARGGPAAAGQAV